MRVGREALTRNTVTAARRPQRERRHDATGTAARATIRSPHSSLSLPLSFSPSPSPSLSLSSSLPPKGPAARPTAPPTRVGTASLSSGASPRSTGPTAAMPASRRSSTCPRWARSKLAPRTCRRAGRTTRVILGGGSTSLTNPRRGRSGWRPTRTSSPSISARTTVTRTTSLRPWQQRCALSWYVYKCAGFVPLGHSGMVWCGVVWCGVARHVLWRGTARPFTPLTLNRPSPRITHSSNYPRRMCSLRPSSSCRHREHREHRKHREHRDSSNRPRR